MDFKSIATSLSDAFCRAPENNKTNKEADTMPIYTEVSQERADILAIMMNLEEQVDSTAGQRRSLETNLDTVQRQLSEEQSVRERLEEKIKSLEAQTAHMDQLSQDASSAMEEQKKLTRQLAESRAESESLTRERDNFTKELTSVRAKLSEESSCGAELKRRIKAIESKSAERETLRQDLTSLTEERNKLANSLMELRPRLEATTMDRSILGKQLASAQAHTKELEGKKAEFEICVKTLKERDSEITRLHSQLTETTHARQDLSAQVNDLSSRIEATDVTKASLEKDLTDANKAASSLREESENLREKLMGAGANEADLRVRFAEQTTDLAIAKERIQKEVAARRQTEEMLSEVKLRLVSLVQKQSVAPDTISQGGMVLTALSA